MFHSPSFKLIRILSQVTVDQFKMSCYRHKMMTGVLYTICNLPHCIRCQISDSLNTIFQNLLPTCEHLRLEEMLENSDSILRESDISTRIGFLPEDLPLTQLPDDYYQPWEAIIEDIVALLQTRVLRDHVANLPILSTGRLRTTAEWQRAYVILSFITHAYIWQGPAPAETLPAQVAMPFLRVADHFDLPTTASYSATNLWNYALVSTSKDICNPDNLRALHTFTGTKDEEWFYMISVAIEARGGFIIPRILDVFDAATVNDSEAVASGLHALSETLDDLGILLDRMYEHCRPDVFYHKIRPMLAGTRNMAAAGLPRGVFYDEEKGAGAWRMYSGGSNAQSSLIQLFDVVLGVRHDVPATINPRARSTSNGYLQEMRRYMPSSHAAFLAYLDTQPSLREYVYSKPADSSVVSAYNAAVTSLTAFRDRHIRIVTRYIVLPSRAPTPLSFEGADINLATASLEGSSIGPRETNLAIRGTGGTELIPFLKRTRDETENTCRKNLSPFLGKIGDTQG